MAFDREKLKAGLAELAREGIYIGGSSWKYPGWCGMLYDEQRYVTKGKFAQARFERQCLTEYAEVFKTVCVDAGYYRFPEAGQLAKLVEQVPSDFRFTFKVTDEITIKKFQNLPRFGKRAGTANVNFLNADMFVAAFLKPFESFKENVGMFIFEFSKFYSTDYTHGRDFVAELDKFLGRLPKGWAYGVEIRNKHFLQPEYFAMLARHSVAHVYNSWTDMPAFHEQIELAGSLTSEEVVGARLLLRPGRGFQEAVDKFSPYNEIKDSYLEARIAVAKLLMWVRKRRGQKKYIYVNNRLEGNSLLTILAILELLRRREQVEEI